MLTSINPLGERGRGNTWERTVAPYLVLSGVGGAMTGGALGALGALLAVPTATGRWVAAATLILAAGADLSARRLPGGHRQVDQDWLTRYRGWFYGAGFGWQLGTGVLTVVTSASTYALLVLLVLTGSPGAGALVGAVFGLVRALPVLVVRPVHAPDQLRALAVRLDAWAVPAARGTAAVLALGGLTLAGVAVTGVAVAGVPIGGAP